MTISEVSRHFDMPIDTIRYYEKIGLMEPVPKDGSGRRAYGEKELRRLRFLKLMRASGVSIERLKEYVELFYVGEDTLPERKQLLVRQREEMQQRIDEMQGVVDELAFIIDNFDGTLARWELMRRHPEQYSEEEILRTERERNVQKPASRRGRR